MRVKLFLGLTVLIIISGVFIYIGTTDNKPYPQLNTTNVKNNNVQLDSFDSLAQNEKVEQKLNRDPSILTINHNPSIRSHFIHNEVSVKFEHYLTKSEIEIISKEIEGSLEDKLDTIYIFKSFEKHTHDLINYFTNRDDVVYAEPNFIYLQNQPNDRFYQVYQWNLPMIRTEAGWNLSTGSEDIHIAVIDSGIDLDHTDLSHRLTKGYNVLVKGSPPDDDNGHGTHVAGIIASETNNREGVAGITWHNKIIPIKAMSSDGYGTGFDIAEGIRWATDHGADVINLSLGNYKDSTVMREAITYAYNKDVVIIAASGNDNTNHFSYPAAYPEVLSVSAVDGEGILAEFSNFGSYVDVVAPGVNIPSTYPNQRYVALSGTSMAAPHVAALAGLIRSLHPNMKNKEVMNVIKDTTIDIGKPGKDDYYGQGLIDIESALKETLHFRYQSKKLHKWFE